MSVSYNSSNLCDRITPPRSIWAQTVDTTSRVYDLGALSVHGHAFCATEADRVWITIQAQTADLFFALTDVNTKTLVPATAVAAGGTPAYADSSCLTCPAGQERSYEIHRINHRYLYLIGSTSGIARIYFSSENTAQDR